MTDKQRKPHVPLFDGSVEILTKEIICRQPTMRLVKLEESHTKFDGTKSRPSSWAALQRKSGVAVIIHNTTTNEILIIEQLRPATFVPHRTDFDTVENVNGRVLELVAGGFNKGEDPVDCVRREVVEEVGLALSNVRFVYDFYLSPGGSNENILLFYAPIKEINRVGEGGGLAEEDEDILTHWISAVVAKEMLHNGEFRDAKTIIGLQWLFSNVIKK